jgi:hypothetical protein
LMTGTEHEFSINDPDMEPLPVADAVLRGIAGKPSAEARLGEILVSKELQMHVVEVKPIHPSESLRWLEATTHRGLRSLQERLGGGRRLMGLGMHPTLRLDQTRVWDGEEGDIYREYHRLFDLRKHGWLNIQALQINIPYGNNRGLVRLFNRIRSVIPYAVALGAASPFVEGSPTGLMDNRLEHYRANQSRLPAICRDVIPEKLANARDYQAIQAGIYRDLRREGAGSLCHEWVNSRGVIVRYSRKCLEIKALDQQECVRSDMALAAFVLVLLKGQSPTLETDDDALRSLLRTAVARGVEGLRPELERLYRSIWRRAPGEYAHYLPLIRKRIDAGSVAEILASRLKGTGDMPELMRAACRSLEANVPLEHGTPAEPGATGGSSEAVEEAVQATIAGAGPARG